MINKEIYPQDVDFQYKIRCSSHQFKPYVYCEMCMVRSQLQSIKEDVAQQTRHMVASSNLNICVTHDIMEKHEKQISELQIELGLLKSKLNEK